jgi:hypothetical protein
MSSQIEVLIRQLLHGPERLHSERATPEHIERNRREIPIQNKINERVWREARRAASTADFTEDAYQTDKP